MQGQEMFPKMLNGMGPKCNLGATRLNQMRLGGQSSPPAPTRRGHLEKSLVSVHGPSHHCQSTCRGSDSVPNSWNGTGTWLKSRFIFHRSPMRCHDRIRYRMCYLFPLVSFNLCIVVVVFLRLRFYPGNRATLRSPLGNKITVGLWTTPTPTCIRASCASRRTNSISINDFRSPLTTAPYLYHPFTFPNIVHQTSHTQTLNKHTHGSRSSNSSGKYK